MSRKQYVILAEGFSSDQHYGKTMWGVLRYRRDDVVAILDSERAPGETEHGVPVVRSVSEALRFEPTAALVGVATQGGRFPPAWIELLTQCVAAGLDVENGLHVFLNDDPELRGSPSGTGSRSGTCAARRPTSRPRPARTSACRDTSSSPSAPTARSGR